MSPLLDAPERWSECASDAERVVWLQRALFTAHRAMQRLSERAQNSPDRIIVRGAIRAIEGSASPGAKS